MSAFYETLDLTLAVEEKCLRVIVKNLALGLRIHPSLISVNLQYYICVRKDCSISLWEVDRRINMYCVTFKQNCSSFSISQSDKQCTGK